MTSTISKYISNVLQQFLSPETGTVPLHEPCIEGNEWHYVKDCLESGWLSSVGNYVKRFEHALQDYTKSKHTIAVSSGTAALEMCLRLCNIQSNQEVLIPDISFVATANAVIYCGATPHFVDVEPSSFGIDPDKLAIYLNEIAYTNNFGCYNRYTGKKIQALIAVHVFGHPADIDPLLNICEKYGIVLIEDAAESLGSFIEGRHTGTIGHLGALSFNGNKIVTSGGGGAILTNSDEIAKQAMHLTTTAKIPHPWEYVHDQTGYNYRLPNINAALGLAQVEKLPHFIIRKRNIAHEYNKLFSKLEGACFHKEPANTRSNYWLNVLLLDSPNLEILYEILNLTHNAGIHTRPVWRPLSLLPMFANSPKMNLDTAYELSQRIISLPSSVNLVFDHQSNNSSSRMASIDNLSK